MIKKLALVALTLSIPTASHAQSLDGQDPMRTACANLLDTEKGKSSTSTTTQITDICYALAKQPYTSPTFPAPVYGALVSDGSGVLHPFYGTYERCLSVYTARKVSLETNGVKNVPLPEEVCLPAR